MAKDDTTDLGIKIGSKDMALWKNTIIQLKAMIENMEKEIKINKTFLLAATTELKKATRNWDKRD